MLLHTLLYRLESAGLGCWDARVGPCVFRTLKRCPYHADNKNITADTRLSAVSLLECLFFASAEMY